MEERGSSFDSRTNQGDASDHDNHGYSYDGDSGGGGDDHVKMAILPTKMQLPTVYNKERLVHHANYIK